MNRILFVDDEKNVLDGLKRMLYPLRNEWDMTFASSGPDALGQLACGPFDVLVTDVRMPGMSGIELLQRVVASFPQLIRIVLSGSADIELTLQSVSLAHQYLMKPCDARTLRAAVQRAVCLRALLYDSRLRDLVSEMQSVPSIPGVYTELVEALRSSEASPATVGAIMARDMGMTVKVLQLVNSAFFGVSREIANPVEAVVYLGMDTVRALVFTVSAFSQFRIPGNCPLAIDELQRHSLAVGTLARRIARSMGLAPSAVEHAFVGGLLHDVGKLLLASNYPDRYRDAMRRVKEEAISLTEAEVAVFGTGHPEIGAYLLWLWGLPDPVAEILALHHRPSSGPEIFAPAVAVHFADALINRYPEKNLDLDCLKILGLESSLPEWRSIYQETTGGAPC